MAGLWEAVEVGVDEWFLGCREGEGPGDGYNPFLDIAHGPGGKAAAEMIAHFLNDHGDQSDDDLDSARVELCRRYLATLGYHVS